MSRTISIGELRKNPTQMLRDVKAGATYTITDHGEPVAEVTPRRHDTWTRSEDVDALLRELGADDEWLDEISDERAAVIATDPWDR